MSGELVNQRGTVQQHCRLDLRLNEGEAVGADDDGEVVGAFVGAFVGACVGLGVGLGVGYGVGDGVGAQHSQ